MKKYLVEVVSQHLVRYVVEAREEEHALDEVTMEVTKEGFKEFSQKFLGDVLLSAREIGDEEYVSLFDQDNSYLSSWPREKKLAMINRIDYGD